jgi:anti-anti-sigma regulatory factor
MTGAAVRGPRAVRPGRSIVRLSGSLDFAAAKELRERLIDVLHRGASPLIIEMLLAAPSPPVAELLRSTGLHRHFTIYPDIPAARASQRNESARTALLESAVS